MSWVSPRCSGNCFQNLHARNRAPKSDRLSSPARPMPGTMRSPPPAPQDEHALHRHDLDPGPSERVAILRIDSRSPPRRLARCRTTARARRIVPTEFSGRLEALAETVRNAPPRSRSPSTPGPCEPMPEACARLPGNRSKRLSASPLSHQPFRRLPLQYPTPYAASNLTSSTPPLAGARAISRSKARAHHVGIFYPDAAKTFSYGRFFASRSRRNSTSHPYSSAAYRSESDPPAGRQHTCHGGAPTTSRTPVHLHRALSVPCPASCTPQPKYPTRDRRWNTYGRCLSLHPYRTRSRRALLRSEIAASRSCSKPGLWQFPLS